MLTLLCPSVIWVRVKLLSSLFRRFRPATVRNGDSEYTIEQNKLMLYLITPLMLTVCWYCIFVMARNNTIQASLSTHCTQTEQLSISLPILNATSNKICSSWNWHISLEVPLSQNYRPLSHGVAICLTTLQDSPRHCWQNSNPPGNKASLCTSTSFRQLF